MERREVDCFKYNDCNNIEFCIIIHLVCTYRCLEFYSLLQAGRSSATHFSYSETEY